MREADRSNVLKLVNQSILCGMTTDSVAIYLAEARKYGKEYGIEGLIDDWAMEGRQVFVTSQAAEEWANTLP